MPFCLKIKLELSGSSGMWEAQGQCCVWRQLGRIAGFSGTPRQTGGRYCWSSSSPPTVMKRMQYRKMVLRIAFITVEQYPIYEAKRLRPSFDDSPFLLRGGHCWCSCCRASALQCLLANLDSDGNILLYKPLSL